MHFFVLIFAGRGNRGLAGVSNLHAALPRATGLRLTRRGRTGCRNTCPKRPTLPDLRDSARSALAAGAFHIASESGTGSAKCWSEIRVCPYCVLCPWCFCRANLSLSGDIHYCRSIETARSPKHDMGHTFSPTNLIIQYLM